MLTKTLKFEDDVIEVLKAMQWSDDGLRGVLVGQLDRKLYERTNKALEAMGGKWNRSAKAHVFAFDPRPQVEGLLDSGTLEVKRDGFFETPHAVVSRMLELLDIRPFHLVLEPSAGMGAIAKAVAAKGANVYCVESNTQRAEALNKMGFNVWQEDFLSMADDWQRFDFVIMNPPFEELQDVDHVQHAYKMLCDGGTLVSIMSESPFFRNDTKSKNFREWLELVGGYSEKLPEGSFKESGTGVNCRLVVIGGA